MDFVLYPLDVQKCPVDFSSYKYTMKAMRFRWKKGNPLLFPNDFGDGFFRLPRYVVSFNTEPESHIVNYGDGNFPFHVPITTINPMYFQPTIGQLV